MRILKQVASKAGKLKKGVSEGGANMGFDEFKLIETVIVKLEQRLVEDLKSDSERKRRDLLKAGKQDEYWQLLKQQAREEHLLLQ